ncbi:hypothetical protein [Vampirovibrio chlorellavorus]|uniref:hypothetical protein n=1 Tax=Vampirovibrio chlorellavorus TaxID=758823 RepID=UPI0026EC6DAB|nr:hypothetical protein [Vampirovibrio chlorellavorus]
MSYQPCRWYDPYPRLAFALKLLYLAPGAMRLTVARQIQRFLVEQWDTPQVRKVLQEIRVKANGNRWYDQDQETAQTVELLKNSPDFLKSRVAENMLQLLMVESA